MDRGGNSRSRNATFDLLFLTICIEGERLGDSRADGQSVRSNKEAARRPPSVYVLSRKECKRLAHQNIGCQIRASATVVKLVIEDVVLNAVWKLSKGVMQAKT